MVIFLILGFSLEGFSKQLFCNISLLSRSQSKPRQSIIGLEFIDGRFLLSSFRLYARHKLAVSYYSYKDSNTGLTERRLRFGHPCFTANSQLAKGTTRRSADNP